MTIPKDS